MSKETINAVAEAIRKSFKKTYVHMSDGWHSEFTWHELVAAQAAIEAYEKANPNQLIYDLNQKISALEKANAILSSLVSVKEMTVGELINALKFYSNESDYVMKIKKVCGGVVVYPNKIIDDYGQIARDALAKLGTIRITGGGE